MQISRVHCPSRQALRDNISKMINIRGQALTKPQLDQLLFDLHKNIEIVTEKTKENAYCKPPLEKVDVHFDNLVQHLHDIVARLVMVKEEFSRTIDVVKAIEYANMIELNVAEFNFFLFKHHKELLTRYGDAHNILCHVDQCLNEIKSVLTNRDTKQVFTRLIDYVSQLRHNLGQLCAKLEKNKISASSSSINSNSSSSYSTQSCTSSLSANSSVNSSLAGNATPSPPESIASTATKTAERLNMALSMAEHAKVPIAPIVKSNFIGFGLAFAVGQLFFNRPNLSSKKLSQLGDSLLLEIKYTAIEQAGAYIHLKDYKSCIAMMVFDKILQKLLIEVQNRLAEAEDEVDAWTDFQGQIKKIKEESRHFMCKCYSTK